MKVVISTLIITLIFAAAVWQLQPTAEQNRLPASVKQGYDLSKLNDEEFVQTAKEVLVNTTKLRSPEKDQMQISFAHMLGPFKKSSVCNTYSLIEVTLTGDGMAVSGELPKLVIDIPCEPNGDRIESEIINLKDPSVKSFNLDGYWISDWYLSSLKLIGEDAYIEVTDTDFRQSFGDVLRL